MLLGRGVRGYGRGVRSAEDDRLFADVKRRLAAAPGVRKVVVFGSRARGDARPDSDLDLVVVADVAGSAGERCRRIGAPLSDLAIPIDLVVYTPEEYERFRTWRSGVAAAAEREGIVLAG